MHSVWAAGRLGGTAGAGSRHAAVASSQGLTGRLPGGLTGYVLGGLTVRLPGGLTRKLQRGLARKLLRGLVRKLLRGLARKLPRGLAGKPSREAGGRSLEVLGAAGGLGPDWRLSGEYSHSAMVIKLSCIFLCCLAELSDFMYEKLG